MNVGSKDNCIYENEKYEKQKKKKKKAQLESEGKCLNKVGIHKSYTQRTEYECHFFMSCVTMIIIVLTMHFL